MLRKKLDYAMIVVGVAVMWISYAVFFIPNRIAPGGFTGVATVLHYWLGMPVGVVVISMNIPLFMLGMKLLGLRFGIRSIMATIGLSVMIDFLPVPALTDDVLLSSVYGGIVCGVGIGLVFRGKATTGGSDLAARLLHHAVPKFTVGWWLFAVDFLVVLLAAVVFEPTLALYALVSLFITSRIADLIMEGSNNARVFWIISEHPAEISRRILADLGRGVTSLSGKGQFSGDEKEVLMCLVYRGEAVQLKNIIAECDSSAFVIISDVREARGLGFKPTSEMLSKKKQRV